MDKLNLDGGSISIGHPFGMTGSRQVGHLTRQLRDLDKQFGIVTMCVGGGMGASGLFERYPS
jgi:acetyl-CoA acyltransferase